MPCIKIESRINMNLVRSKSGVLGAEYRGAGISRSCPSAAAVLAAWEPQQPCGCVTSPEKQSSCHASQSWWRTWQRDASRSCLVLSCFQEQVFVCTSQTVFAKCQASQTTAKLYGYFHSLLTWMQTLWLVSCISQIIIRISFVSFCLCLLFKHLCSCSVSSINMKGLISFYMFVDLCL